MTGFDACELQLLGAAFGAKVVRSLSFTHPDLVSHGDAIRTDVRFHLLAEKYKAQRGPGALQVLAEKVIAHSAALAAEPEPGGKSDG